MDFPRPSEIRVDEVSRSMIGDLDDVARQVNEIRPLDPAVLSRVEDDLLGQRVYNSNAIEGNTLTIRETSLILKTKSIADVRKQREAREALNLGEAATRVGHLTESDDAWRDVSTFLDLHETLMKGVNDPIAGAIRNQDVMISGAKHQPPSARDVSDLVDTFFEYLRDSDGSSDALVRATWAHWAITRIHPFVDGNGRLARLWQDLLLLRSRLTVAIIRPQDRDAYIDALGAADEGEFNPLIQLICGRVISTFQVYLNAQEEADSLHVWAAGLVGESSARRKIDYQRWRRNAETVRDAFGRCAAILGRGGDRSLEIQFQSSEILDQPTWETLLLGGEFKNALFFHILFRKDRPIVRYDFSFRRPEWTTFDTPSRPRGSFVAIRANEHRMSPREPADALAESENPVGGDLELLVSEGEILHRRRDPTSGEMAWDPVPMPIEVAKEFFEDVLLNKLK